MKTKDTEISQESQREMAVGVLKQAAQDLRRFHDAASKIERELYVDAHSWIMSDDCTWPFSFLNVCRLLNHSPEDLRVALVGDLSLGVFAQWVRRGSRAFRRLSDSLAHRLATDRNPSAALPTQMIQTWH